MNETKLNDEITVLTINRESFSTVRAPEYKKEEEVEE